MSQKITVADLVAAVSESARSEAEFVAAVVHLVNSGAVKLEGRLRGARIELPGPRATAARLRG